MDGDVVHSPDDPLPEPRTETSADPGLEAAQREFDADQRDILAAVYAAHLDERERLQDNREDLRNAYHHKRDRVADERDEAADVRDEAADVRDEAADVRDRLANLREAQADERELIDLERYLRAGGGETAAGQQDRESRTDPGE